MTKEIRPAHRVDIISQALLYYGIKTKQKLRESFSQYELYLLKNSI